MGGKGRREANIRDITLRSEVLDSRNWQAEVQERGN